VAPVTLTRQQRDVIYGQLLVELTAIGDIYIALSNGDYDTAKRYRRQFEDDLRLLDDLGWEPDPSAQQFEITMERHDLARSVARLHQLATEAVGEHLRRPTDNDLAAERQVVACQAYADILSQLRLDG
jgi:hypothetical protein